MSALTFGHLVDNWSDNLDRSAGFSGSFVHSDGHVPSFLCCK